jgi:hypothetical protein
MPFALTSLAQSSLTAHHPILTVQSLVLPGWSVLFLPPSLFLLSYLDNLNVLFLWKARKIKFSGRKKGLSVLQPDL